MNRWISNQNDPPLPSAEGISDHYIPLTVETIDNHVYFYADVNSDRCLALIQQIRQIDSHLRTERASREITDLISPVPIWLHIHSYGGHISPAMALADQLRNITTPIYSIVEGMCASAATLISTVCHRRFITPNSFMLIHQLRTFMWGRHDELADNMKMLDMAMESIVKIYAEHTKMSKGEIEKLLGRDSWFNAEECVKLGLVDEFKGARPANIAAAKRNKK